MSVFSVALHPNIATVQPNYSRWSQMLYLSTQCKMKMAELQICSKSLDEALKSWHTVTLCACVPDRELWGGGVFFNFGISRHSTDSGRKGRDAASQEREPSQRATIPDANYRCHPSALGMQRNVG